jgi:hypothetical protein
MHGKFSKKNIHDKTRHEKLRGPDWYVSALILDRTIDAITRRLVINRKYHVPYLAGYSEDGSTIYIDRDLPQSFRTRSGDIVHTDRYLILHEAVEKSLLLKFSLRYQHAHQVALRTEEAAVRGDGVPWWEYDGFMQAFIKEADQEKPLHLPPDLDLKPYIDEHDKELVAQMRLWRNRRKGKAKQVSK